MTDTLDHDTREGLYITDAELIRRLGLPEKVGYAAIHALDRDKASGFPQKKAFWGNRRYWPAVKAYMDRTNGLKLDVPQRRSTYE